MSGSSLQVDFVLLFDEAKVLLQFGLNRGRTPAGLPLGEAVRVDQGMAWTERW